MRPLPDWRRAPTASAAFFSTLVSAWDSMRPSATMVTSGTGSISSMQSLRSMPVPGTVTFEPKPICSVFVVATMLPQRSIAQQWVVDSTMEARAEPARYCFARDISKLLDDAELAERMGEAGRRLVEARYGWGSSIERLVEFHREVIEARGTV